MAQEEGTRTVARSAIPAAGKAPRGPWPKRGRVSELGCVKRDATAPGTRRRPGGTLRSRKAKRWLRRRVVVPVVELQRGVVRPSPALPLPEPLGPPCLEDARPGKVGKAADADRARRPAHFRQGPRRAPRVILEQGIQELEPVGAVHGPRHREAGGAADASCAGTPEGAGSDEREEGRRRGPTGEDLLAGLPSPSLGSRDLDVGQAKLVEDRREQVRLLEGEIPARLLLEDPEPVDHLPGGRRLPGRRRSRIGSRPSAA